MCGIAGFIDRGMRGARDRLLSTVTAMADTLVHRGPDDAGVYCDESAGVALGHRRLSVIDLSAEGRQPMTSESGRYVIVYNGEIYNFSELRDELVSLGHVFRGRSDTEVLLAAVEEWSLEGVLDRCRGMFAFALWDLKNRTLSLARDRLGEKPLYYADTGRSFLFSSELKGLKAHPLWEGEVDAGVLASYLRHGYVPAPYSIYRGVCKLMPGTVLTVDAEGGEPLISVYWSARNVAERGAAEPFSGSDDEALDILHNLLSASVREKMVADVPVGAFLSGGVDSSTIVSLMAEAGAGKVKTFTVGFEEAEFNEAGYAHDVAKHLGTEHHELCVTSGDAMKVIPGLPGLYDEPFADPSQIPSYLVSGLARGHVTVALSGDGGDELFAGYNHYRRTGAVWKRIGGLPRAARRLAALSMDYITPERIEGLAPVAAPFMRGRGREALASDRLERLRDALGFEHFEMMYLDSVSCWRKPREMVAGSGEAVTIFRDQARWPAFEEPVLKGMYLDTVTYLPDDILVKVDRATMAVSLESRIPLLDHRVVEFAWTLPLSMKMRGARGKWILRALLGRYLPSGLIERPKKGFGVPVGKWIRGPLREWAEELLDERRLATEGYLDVRRVRAAWKAHLDGRDHGLRIWNLLVFQQWLEAEKKREEGGIGMERNSGTA